ncbi:MAG TPA: hypothetical protein VFU10_09625 [Gaiellaceae bacterium]|nr:hypothetical protein [Gaiellaceae bacterium]
MISAANSWSAGRTSCHRDCIVRTSRPAERVTGDARRIVHGRAEEVVGLVERITRMQADPDADGLVGESGSNLPG